MCKCTCGSQGDDLCRSTGCLQDVSPIPHKHAAVIKAWADGAQIEYRPPSRSKAWYDCVVPRWSMLCDYRVKPVKKSLGQIAYDEYFSKAWAAVGWFGLDESVRARWEGAAQAVKEAVCAGR